MGFQFKTWGSGFYMFQGEPMFGSWTNLRRGAQSVCKHHWARNLHVGFGVLSLGVSVPRFRGSTLQCQDYLEESRDLQKEDPV